jgi:hypothetical protein
LEKSESGEGGIATDNADFNFGIFSLPSLKPSATRGIWANSRAGFELVEKLKELLFS